MEFFIIPILVTAIINWIASEREWNLLVYITKPLTLILMIAWFSAATQWRISVLWFGLGLVFSLGGDILLMLPKQKFLAGLVSFLIAHLMYIIGLNSYPFPITLPGVLMTLLVLFLFTSLVRYFYFNMRADGHQQSILPVLIYMTVLSAMVLSAVLCLVNPAWHPLSALFVAAGAVSFYYSDITLGWNRFISPVEHRNLKVMASYHLGQLGILLGVLLQLGS